uniref:ATP synthase complex subunit 8 n=1 Tax=Trigonopteryx hopei TaxID=62799 RepID=M4JCH5_9ORTH|nr:ATP synthase F0 subunit 8 [Trigonopteryx hopei]
MYIPQMYPMMWFTLFIMFTLSMVMLNQMNFFMFNQEKIKSLKQKTNSLKNKTWLW